MADTKPMTDGERLVWAASYACLMRHGSRAVHAACNATNFVKALRLVEDTDVKKVCGSDERWRADTVAAVAEMRSREVDRALIEAAFAAGAQAERESCTVYLRRCISGQGCDRALATAATAIETGAHHATGGEKPK